MKTRTILFLICLLFTTQINANDIEDNEGEIIGIIIDKETSEPIPYASIALISSNDSSIITGVITLEDGSFRLEEVPFGTYKVKATYIGYSPVTIDNVVVSSKNKTIDLKTVMISEDITQLDEAEVVHERLRGEEKIDRTVFTVNDQTRKTASSGIGLLRNIPSVSVDLQDNVMLEGSSNIQFYVDGVLRNKDYVAQLDPELIDKVELITNPGVKYSAEITGVINIILKKTQRYGVNGSVTAPLFHPKKIFINPSANIEYGNQNFRVYVGERSHYEEFDVKEYSKTIVDGSISDSPYEFEQNTNGRYIWLYSYMNAGIDWFVSDNTTINVLGEWTKYKNPIKDFLTTNSTIREEVQTNYFLTDREGVDNSDNYYLSLFLKHNFAKEGSELTAEMYTNQHASNIENEYLDTYYGAPSFEDISTVVERNEYTDNITNTLEFRLDYTFLTKNIKHELGLREQIQGMENQFLKNNTIEAITGEEAENFEYTENRHVAYYNASGKLNDFSWQAGLRGEYSDINIQDTSSIDYFVMLPQLTAAYKLADNKNVKFTYRRQIIRPSVYNLNPFETYIDSLQIKKGNPDLKPTHIHRLELTYTQNFGNNYISPKFFVNFFNDGITEITRVSEDGLQLISQENIGKRFEYGVTLSTSVQFFKKLNINGNVSVYNSSIDDPSGLSLEKNNQKVSCWAFLNTMYITKVGAFFVYTQYVSPQITYQRTRSRDLLMYFGYGAGTEKFQAVLIYNPFIKNFRYNKMVAEYPGYYWEQYQEINIHHAFAIHLTYKFNFGGKIKKLERNAEYEKNESEGAL